MNDIPRELLPAEAPIALDATRLRALAHPIRVRLMWELGRHGRARTSDLATAVEQPPNKVSYHLRLLAEHGIIAAAEPPAAGGDGRESWWRLASGTGVTWESNDPATAAFAADVEHVVDELRADLRRRSRSLNRDKGFPALESQLGVALTRDEAVDLRNRLLAIVTETYNRRVERLEPEDRSGADVEYFLSVELFPVRLLERDAPAG